MWGFYGFDQKQCAVNTNKKQIWLGEELRGVEGPATLCAVLFIIYNQAVHQSSMCPCGLFEDGLRGKYFGVPKHD